MNLLIIRLTILTILPWCFKVYNQITLTIAITITIIAIYSNFTNNSNNINNSKIIIIKKEIHLLSLILKFNNTQWLVIPQHLVVISTTTIIIFKGILILRSWRIFQFSIKPIKVLIIKREILLWIRLYSKMITTAQSTILRKAHSQILTMKILITIKRIKVFWITQKINIK